MTLLIAAVAPFLTGCRHAPAFSCTSFKHLPATGWQRTMPLTFDLQYADSVSPCTITLVVRHDNTYRYRNLPLVVDLIADDSTVVSHPVDVAIADEYGNWKGGGFGPLYQRTVTVASGVEPARARHVVMWQAMQDCDTLTGVVDVGIIARME